MNGRADWGRFISLAPPYVRLGDKTITKSDTNGHQSRLLIRQPLCRSILQQATEAELATIKSAGGLPVEVLDSKGRSHSMVAKVRPSDNQEGMVFNGSGWNVFVGANDLQVGYQLSIYFRTNEGALSFAFL